MSYVKIDDNSRILLEDNNYTLEYRVKAGKKPDGSAPTSEYKWILGGYYATLEHLATSWVENAPSHQKDGDLPITTMKQLVECIQYAEKHITNLIKGIK